MDRPIGAIQTQYKGYKFRSRLEARWAVFLDSLCIAWEYEPEGFTLPSGPYLPDFWLAGARVFAEVKPAACEPDEMRRAIELATFTSRRVLLLEGVPDETTYWMIDPSLSRQGSILPLKAIRWDSAEEPFAVDETYLRLWPERMRIEDGAVLHAVRAARQATFGERSRELRSDFTRGDFITGLPSGVQECLRAEIDRQERSRR